ncbi:E3 ubiquitin-protein ligase TRIM56-like [Dendronephthya gigantea]|uniref:E3 ubiquitin-protein ligase TRIM56-like n=1 Tax=Dendronephthya gigantea TaxID=151771 RepID=UPI00106A220E|nr:E3 ubiquitin-protein ligase TRIM56-like [Dendronephthya gigantea]
MANDSPDSGSVDEITDLLTCSLCSNILHDPKSLTCLHNFCKGCLEKYVERLHGGDQNIETFPCPKCRLEFTFKSHQDLAEMRSNCFIKNLLDILEIQQRAKSSTECFRCKDPAIKHCSSCEIFMCDKCSEWHDIWPAHKHHNVLSVKELSCPKSQIKMRRKLHCMKHKDKVLDYFCESCKELCCIDCVVLNHQKPDHSCVAMSEVAQKQKETLQSSCSTLDKKLSEASEALTNIESVMKSLEENAKTAKDKIKEQKEKVLKIVTEKVDERTKKMNEEVDKAYDELHSELNKQHDEIKGYHDKLQASMPLPKSLLKRGSIEEILSLQKQIDESIKKLQEEKPDDLTAVNVGDIQHVPGDIDNINVDEVVDKLGHIEEHSGFLNLRNLSSILKGEIAFIKQLQKWLGEKCNWNLCYRASRDGWGAQNFHAYCDNKGPTVVLVKANNCIFGGYTDQTWHRQVYCYEEDDYYEGNYRHSNCSFLFSLRNKVNLGPFIANIKQGQEGKAIYCNNPNGPVFGGGNDLNICDSPNVNKSYCNFGSTYQLPSGYTYASKRAKKLLAGQYQFLTTEIEVFY